LPNALVATGRLEAWNSRGADGSARIGTSEIPARRALGILSIEFLVHAWDFARATGQQLTVSEPVAGHVLEVAWDTITDEGRATVGFAAPMPPAPGAGPMDQLIAFTGRVP
jgi:uncharacterized protein (TIGR03086 family)